MQVVMELKAAGALLQRLLSSPSIPFVASRTTDDHLLFSHDTIAEIPLSPHRSMADERAEGKEKIKKRKSRRNAALLMSQDESVRIEVSFRCLSEDQSGCR